MKTNMNELRRIAKTLLHTTLTFDEKFSFIVHHPFFENEVYAVKEKDKIKLLNLSNRKELEMARIAVKEKIDEAQDVFDFFMLITKPYLPAFFKYANPYMSKEDFSKFLSEMWITVEFPNRDKNISMFQFVNLFEKADKSYLMTKEDKDYFDNLPDVVEIYRGISLEGRVCALSWTTDVEKARWFANRWSENGQVYSAKINKENILAYFSTRGENEVVVNFKKLENIQKI